MGRLSVSVENGFNARTFVDVGNGWVDARSVRFVSDIHEIDRGGWQSKCGSRGDDLLTSIGTDFGTVASTLPRRVVWRRIVKALQQAEGE